MYLKKPGPVKNMTEYWETELKPYISDMVKNYCAQTVAIAWDLYFHDSIKLVRETREADKGLRQQDLPMKGRTVTFLKKISSFLLSPPKPLIFHVTGRMPRNWESYLKNPENKIELFKFLAERFLESSSGYLRVTNVGEKLLSSDPESSVLHGVNCSGKEEADGRIVLHIKDIVQHGGRKVLVRCSDADIVFLCISFYHRLKGLGLEEL